MSKLPRIDFLLRIFALLGFASIGLADPPEGYRLVWSDEFDGDSLNTSAWAYREDNKHRSLQRRENVTLGDGRMKLTLRVLDEPVEGKRASGGGIISRERFHYGYYEVRARLGVAGEPQRGWHHSFWAQAAEITEEGTVSTTYPGIRRTEIDCFENASEHRHDKAQANISRFTQHVIVWNESGRESERLPKPPADLTAIEGFEPSDWHTYAFLWTEEGVTFYVDGAETHFADYPASRYEHDRINLWLTAISANWNSADPLPSSAEYDYIRVYQE